MTNKTFERLATIQLKMPAAIAISSGSLLIFGTSKTLVGVAADGQVASPPANYDDNSGYVTVDFEGVFTFTATAQTSKSPSAGAAITPGSAIYADGGTYDPTTGITYGSSIDMDTNGTFIGLSMDSLAAGATGSIRVILKNCGS